MRFHSYFNTAVLIIKAYDGGMPLAHYLKQYFAQHKKHGSKDRKYISHLCYCFYRLGHALRELPVEERLKAALYLCTDDIAEWAILLDDNWLKQHSLLVRKRIAFIQTAYPQFKAEDIFPWTDELSEGIDKEAFVLSHLVQPDLFLRVRPGHKAMVAQKLKLEGISFTQPSENTFALPNATKIDTLIELNKEAVVQDYSSQRVAELLSLITPGKQPLTVWDCCAASGGKSLLVYDTFKHIKLTVSDIRSSIINNLQQRFALAGIRNYESFVADISNPENLQSAIANLQYQCILADAPCTGSGTWARTPEQLYFFTEEKIAHYTTLQQKIMQNVIPYIKPGGYLLYITCSVLAKENEAQVPLALQHGLTLVQEKILAGYNHKADTMFAALFTKPQA